MTSPGRLYVVAGTLLAFFLLWAGIAASPWRIAQPDPRVEALARREAVVRRSAAAAELRHAQRWADYRTALAARRQAQPVQAAAAAQPTVRVVQLPPVATTRSS